MVPRQLGRSGISLSPIGFGAFKIGRNEKIKYDKPYPLPDEAQVERLLNGVLDLGINYIDTAPAYGLSEQRIGRAIAHRRGEYVLSTKVGETFEDGRSTYDFSPGPVRQSVQRSLERLKTDLLDIVFIHSDGAIETSHVAGMLDQCVDTLQTLRDEGLIRLLGFSGKTVDGARNALKWADVLMVEFHLDDRSHEPVIAEAAAAGVGVVVKKGLASGRLPAEDAIRFVLSNPHVTSMVIGGLNLGHIASNIEAASAISNRL